MTWVEGMRGEGRGGGAGFLLEINYFRLLTTYILSVPGDCGKCPRRLPCKCSTTVSLLPPNTSTQHN